MNQMKILRDRENMTGTKLARRVGVTPSMIYMVENGQKNPSIMLAYRIAQALNASIEEVFFDTSIYSRTCSHDPHTTH